MYRIFPVLLFLFSAMALADDTSTVLAKYLDTKVSDYEIPCKPNATGSKEIECVNFSGYYVYTVKPVSSAKAPKTIRVALVSHSVTLRESNNLWLLELKKLSKRMARKIGADYEIVAYAETDSNRFCSYKRVSLSNWLYPTVTRPSEAAVGDTFCYSVN